MRSMARFFVWGVGRSSSALVRNGETTTDSIAVRATEAMSLDEDHPLRSDEAWCVEVDCDEDDLDAETRHDAATLGYASPDKYQDM